MSHVDKYYFKLLLLLILHLSIAFSQDSRYDRPINIKIKDQSDFNCEIQELTYSRDAEYKLVANMSNNTPLYIMVNESKAIALIGVKCDYNSNGFSRYREINVKPFIYNKVIFQEIVKYRPGLDKFNFIVNDVDISFVFPSNLIGLQLIVNTSRNIILMSVDCNPYYNQLLIDNQNNTTAIDNQGNTITIIAVLSLLSIIILIVSVIIYFVNTKYTCSTCTRKEQVNTNADAIYVDAHSANYNSQGNVLNNANPTFSTKQGEHIYEEPINTPQNPNQSESGYIDTYTPIYDSQGNVLNRNDPFSSTDQ